MAKVIKTATPEMKETLRKSAARRDADAAPHLVQIAKAFEGVLRKGVLVGDNLDNIYQSIPVDTVSSAEFPLDLYAPGSEGDYAAYTLSNQGTIPHASVEGDYVMVPIYDIGNGIDWGLKYAKNARWDIVSRCRDVMMAGMTKKMNDDGWHVLLAAGFDRDIMVFDSDANAGQFTKRLLSLAKVIMRRNGGGNSNSQNRGVLTDVYFSPECLEDIRNWNVDQIDEVTRREIYTAADGKINRVFGVNLHDMDELGEEQEYQTYFTSTLGGTLTSGDVELMVGLDLRNTDSFVMPSVGEIEVFEDMTMHRQRRAGLYCWKSLGFAALDNRRIILLSS